MKCQEVRYRLPYVFVKINDLWFCVDTIDVHYDSNTREYFADISVFDIIYAQYQQTALDSILSGDECKG